ncbi:hypothetical protein LJC74_06525 [Eubacteriales bacterium OttesenSCG-928-A19]|nr:hypothetical protein [Eubacteriales bacterium OttesenSCG-928-A19]
MITDREMAAEVLRRTALYRRKQAEKRHKMTITISVAACLSLIIWLAMWMPSVSSDTVQGRQMYSASLMGAGTAGGYVLVGVLAFMLGTLVSWLGIRAKRQDAHRQDGDDDA